MSELSLVPLLVLLGPSEGWTGPPTLGVGICFTEPPIQMLISSGSTSMTHPEIIFSQISRHLMAQPR